jgi:hypothetical protein
MTSPHGLIPPLIKRASVENQGLCALWPTFKWSRNFQSFKEAGASIEKHNNSSFISTARILVSCVMDYSNLDKTYCIFM